MGAVINHHRETDHRRVSCFVPSSGYKSSGPGRESGAETLAAYTQTRTGRLSAAREQPDPLLMR